MSENRKIWEDLQDRLAGESGLAIVVADENSKEFSASNNNSICQVLYNSEEFAPECAKFCGKAYQMVAADQKSVNYQCYAGLDCQAVPIKKGEKQIVAIVGRAFTKAENYRKATERAITGDWQKFPPTKVFENVLLSGSAGNLEKVAKSLENLNDRQKDTVLSFILEPQKETAKQESPVEKNSAKTPETAVSTGEKIEIPQVEEIAKLVEQFHQAQAQTAEVSEKIFRRSNREAEEITAWRAFFGSLLDLNYKDACLSVLKFLSKRYALSNLAWLDRRENRLETVLAGGILKGQQIQISISADDQRLLEAVKKGSALELREKKRDAENAKTQIIQLFPIAVGGEIRSAIVVGDDSVSEKMQRQITRFSQNIASELEILRLREELARRVWLADAVGKFNESLKNIDTDDFWMGLAQVSAELMRAERSSLLLFDETNNLLTVKAAIGVNAEEIRQEAEKIGARVARNVLQSGKSVVVRDVEKIGLGAAPSEWKYKSKSFISYPIMIGSRKIGVLNVTDRADGEVYGEFDLELLRAIAPSLAVLIDRAALKHKAGEFEQLSVTDALTGLLNRRYLEVRLAEEIKRSNRHGFPMSFLMIDVDDFGKFNKDFGVLVGDNVLREAVKAMTSTLRGADIAARYGGEEFCVLLPQTTLSEAQTIAERIRQSVEEINFPQRPITVSIGITAFSFGISTPEAIIKAADEALREAKKQGKNNSQVYILPVARKNPNRKGAKTQGV